MEKEELEKYKKAGKILKKAKEKARKIAVPGRKMLDIAVEIEQYIERLGKEEGETAKPAFPVNLSINEEAAHRTPKFDDEMVFEESQVLKLDIGVHVDGFIADCAFTMNPDNRHVKLVETAELALENALSIVKPGVEIGKIGEEIENTIRGRGFNPVQNLSGHGLAPYLAHAPPTIPNIANKNPSIIEDEMIFAIEPFATDGKGFVRESGNAEIFSVEEPKAVRNLQARKILEFALEEFKTLPFAERWILEKFRFSEFQHKLAMRELVKNKCFRAYPVLREEPGKLVSQAETTVLIEEGKLKILV